MENPILKFTEGADDTRKFKEVAKLVKDYGLVKPTKARKILRSGIWAYAKQYIFYGIRHVESLLPVLKVPRPKKILPNGPE